MRMIIAYGICVCFKRFISGFFFLKMTACYMRNICREASKEISLARVKNECGLD